MPSYNGGRLLCLRGWALFKVAERDTWAVEPGFHMKLR
jgi:hypothetical protein